MPVKKVLGAEKQVLRGKDGWTVDGQPATLEEAMDAKVPDNPPRYEQYQVPGGTNYRETLSVMPGAKPNKPIVQVFGAFPRQFDTLAEAEAYVVQLTEAAQSPGMEALRERIAQYPLRIGENGFKTVSGNFQSPHFPRTPNILVHTRSNQRTLPTGERGTLVENVQSDWHQAGRKEGYKLPSEITTPMDAEYRQLVHKNADARAQGYEPSTADIARAQELQTALIRSDSSEIPDAPFKDSWPALGLKQEILDAVERGDEWIGITPAATLNTRGEAISEAFQDQRLPLTLEKILQPFGGGKVERGSVNAGRQSFDHVLIEQPRRETPWAFPASTIDDNSDLVGGVFDRATKRQLASVLPPPKAEVPRINDAYRLGYDNRGRNLTALMEQTSPPGTTDAFLTRLTPEMREQIKQKGLPLLALMLAARLRPEPSHQTKR